MVLIPQAVAFASDREGGRIVRKLIADHIESAIQHAATTDPDRYRTSHRIVLTLADDAPTSTSGEPTDADTAASLEPGGIIVTFE